MSRRIALLLLATLAVGCSSGGSSRTSPLAVPTTLLLADATHNGALLSDAPLLGMPGSLDAHRITYRSTNDRGEPVEVTGAVLVPNGKAPPTGWPIVSWGHGTSGLADKCAPSLTSGMAGTGTALAVLVAAGYVVTATDYEGLGGPGGHPYLDGNSEGRSMIDAVRAARELVPDASDTWFSVGHSQGGQAALFGGELAGTYGDGLRLAGVIGIAPASQLPLFPKTAGTPAQLFVPMLASGVVAADPTVSLSQILAPAALAKAGVLETGCVGEINAAYATLPGTQLFAPGGDTLPAFVSYLERSDPGHRPTAVPMLIVQGDADDTVPPVLTTALMANLCAQHDAVTLKTYPGAGHTDVIARASLDMLSFLDALRKGADPPSPTCP